MAPNRFLLISLVLLFGSLFVAGMAPAMERFVAIETLNVRSEPFADSEVIYQLQKNDRIEVLGELNGWGAIEDPDRPGVTLWISLEFLNEQPIPAQPEQTSVAVSDSEFIDYVKVGFVVIGLLILLGSKGGKRDRRRKSGFKDDNVPSWKGMLIGILMMGFGWLL